MKIRNGFVSNSSSSSFLILGVDGKDFKALHEDIRMRICEGDLEDGYTYDSDEGVAGYELGCFGDGSSVSLSLASLATLAPEVAQQLGVQVTDLKVIAWECYN